MHLESLVSDATTWSVTLESSMMILEASFALIYDVYNASITNDNCQLMIKICLKYRPQSLAKTQFKIGRVNASLESFFVPVSSTRS
jgi:hypothetical protein